MTMTVEQAAVAVRNLAKQYRAVLEVGAILDEMGDLNRARLAAEHRTIDAQENQRRAEEALQATYDAVAQAELKLADVKQAAANAVVEVDRYVTDKLDQMAKDVGALKAEAASEIGVARD